MTEYIFTNNAKSKLAVAMGGGDLTLQVESGDGALFPDPTDPEVFVILVKQGSTQAYMTCTSRAGDVLTVTRTDSYSFTAGDSPATVKLVITAAILDSFLQKGVYRTCDGDPDGVETAAYAGEEIYDSTNDLWYKAVPDGTSWKVMSA